MIPNQRKLSDNPHLPDEARRGLIQYERGQELLSITAVSGWPVILDLLKEEIESDERKFLAYRDSDPHELFRLHAELQGKKKLLTRLEATVKFHIELVSNPPEAIQKYITF